ncbi:MAG: glycosyltransferase family 2 protein [Cytophagales bacterium]|nr:MAG: glycosyltransferase family 2 protein [Cytophagales bacterium]
MEINNIQKVYIVILNFNGWRHTIECLESVFKLKYSNFSIVVVDNNSTDDSVKKIISWAKGDIQVKPESSCFDKLVIPNVSKPLKLCVLNKEDIKDNFSYESNILTLIPNNNNFGFADGNNIGITYAINQKDCKYVWLLNNDTVVPEDCLDGLISVFSKKTNEKIGIVGSKLLYYRNPTTIQNIGVNYYKWIAYTKEIGAFETDKGQFDKDNIQVDLVQGASMFVTKDYIQEVGMLSTDYFLYFEEVDWSIRGKELGYKCKYSPNSVVYHKSGAATGGNSYSFNKKSEISDFFHLRNKIIITRKFYPICLISLYPSYIFPIMNRIKRKQFKRLITIFKIIFTT